MRRLAPFRGNETSKNNMLNLRNLTRSASKTIGGRSLSLVHTHLLQKKLPIQQVYLKSLKPFRAPSVLYSKVNQNFRKSMRRKLNFDTLNDDHEDNLLAWEFPDSETRTDHDNVNVMNHNIIESTSGSFEDASRALVPFKRSTTDRALSLIHNSGEPFRRELTATVPTKGVYITFTIKVVESET